MPLLPQPYRDAVDLILAQVSRLRTHNEDNNLPFTFSPGDKLIGDIGEAMGVHLFNLEAHPNGNRHDWLEPVSGRIVKVRTKSTLRIGNQIRLDGTQTTHLLAFELDQGGNYILLYNGSGANLNGQASISVNRLQQENALVPDNERLPFFNA